MTSAVATYLATGTSSATTGTTLDFGNFTSAADGVIVVLLQAFGGTTGTFTGCTIGGVAATQQLSSNSSGRRWAIFYLQKTAGTYDISCTLSAAIGSSAAITAGVYNVTGSSGTPLDAGHTGATGTVTSIAQNVNTTSGDCAIYGLALANTATWSAAGSDYNAATNFLRFQYAHKNGTAAQTPHTETATFTNNGNSIDILGVSFQIPTSQSDTLALAQLVLTSFGVTESISSSEALALAQELLTSFAVTESFSLAEPLALAQSLFTSFGVTEAITSGDTLGLAQMILTSFGLAESMTLSEALNLAQSILTSAAVKEYIDIAKTPVPVPSGRQLPAQLEGPLVKRSLDQVRVAQSSLFQTRLKKPSLS